MKKLNCIMTAFIVFILQSAVLPFMFNGVSQPNLIFVFVVLMALHHGQRIGIITALLGGFCQDVIIGNFFGMHLLVYLIVALVCSYLGRDIDKDQWVLTLLIVLGATEVGLAPDLRLPLPGRPVHQYCRLLIGIQHTHACLSRVPGPARRPHRLALAP